MKNTLRNHGGWRIFSHCTNAASGIWAKFAVRVTLGVLNLPSPPVTLSPFFFIKVLLRQTGEICDVVDF